MGTSRTTNRAHKINFNESINARVTTCVVAGENGEADTSEFMDCLNLNMVENTAVTAQIRDAIQSTWMTSKKLPDEPKESMSFECPHQGCVARFETVKKLKRHKGGEHDFCKFHNLDFESFEALLAHKIESSEHITCPICGMDFKSLSGRERHVVVIHPKVQKCECPGCENVYTKAAALMHHIENNLCSGITWAQYMKVYLKNSLLAGHIENLDTGVVVPGTEDNAPSIKDTSEFPQLGPAPDGLNGGEAQNVEQTPQSRTLVMEPWMERIQQASERKSKRVCLNQLSNSLSHESCEDFPDRLGLENDNDGEDLKHRHEDAYLIDGEIKEEIKIKPLMPLADLPADKGTRMKRLGRMMWGENAIEKLNNIISPKDVPSHMNPFSDRFDAESFKLLGKYRCPNLKCLKRFDKGRDLAAHMQSPAHYSWECRCPQCFSVFKGAAALVSHMEAPSFRCRIKESKYFKDALEVATSGFLAHERWGNEHIFKGKEPVFE